MENKALKLWKMFAKFANVETDKGLLTIDGELEVGANVFDENNEPAADGEYELDDKILVVLDGKISDIKEKEEKESNEEEIVEDVVEEVIEEELEAAEEEKETEEIAEEVAEEEQAEDEKDLRIKELEAVIESKDAEIQALNEKIKELEDKSLAPVEEPVELSKKCNKFSNSSNPALKYFN